MTVLFVIMTIIIALTVDYLLQRRVKRRSSAQHDAAFSQRSNQPVLPAPPPATFILPSHLWFELLPSGSIRLGVDTLISTLMGTPHRIEHVAEGTTVDRDAPLLTLSTGERSLSLKAPENGRLERIRGLTDISTLQRQPYKSNWLCELRVQDLGSLIRRSRIGPEARSWLSTELTRLRDYLCHAQRGGTGDGSVTLAEVAADGGYPIAGVAEQLDNESWQALVEHFFTDSDGWIASPRSAGVEGGR